MSQRRGPKGEADHTGRLVFPPEKKSIDTNRIAREAEAAQRRAKAGGWK